MLWGSEAGPRTWLPSLYVSLIVAVGFKNPPCQ